MSNVSLALQSASILLREGIEAMLVVAALAAFLRRSGAVAELKAIYIGHAGDMLSTSRRHGCRGMIAGGTAFACPRERRGDDA